MSSLSLMPFSSGTHNRGKRQARNELSLDDRRPSPLKRRGRVFRSSSSVSKQMTLRVAHGLRIRSMVEAHRREPQILPLVP